MSVTGAQTSERMARAEVLAWVLIPIALALGAAGLDAMRSEKPQYECWLLPNAAVTYTTVLDPRCALNAYDRIMAVRIDGEEVPINTRSELEALTPRDATRIEVLVSDRHRHSWVDLQVVRDPRSARGQDFLIALALVITISALALSIALRAAMPAARAIALVASTTGVFLTVAVYRSSSPALDVMWIVAQGMLPATCFHLALCFPRDRRLLERAPQILPLIYLAVGFLVLFELGMLRRSSMLWELPDRTIGTLTFAASSAVIIACFLTLKESDSAREKAQARIFLYIAVGLVGIFAFLSLGVGASLPDFPRRTIAGAFTLFLLVATFATTRFALFDVPLAVRWLTSYLVYTTAVSALLYAGAAIRERTIGIPMPDIDPVIVLGATFVGLVALSAVRHLAWGAAEAWATPWAPRLAQARARHAAYIARSDDADAAARGLAVAIDEAFHPRGVGIYLRLASAGWRLAHLVGEIEGSRSAAEHGAQIIGRDEQRLRESAPSEGEEAPARPVVINLEDRAIADEEASAQLRERGVDLVCALYSGDELVGLALVDCASKIELFSSDHRDFLEQACAHTGLAIGFADAQQRLQISARMTAIGHAAAGLTHDLGRPIGEIYVEAGNLLEVEEAPPALRAGLVSIKELSTEILERLDGFVRDGQTGPEDDRAAVRMAVVLEAACDRIAKLNDGKRPVLRMTTQLPLVDDPANLQRVVENLLENAAWFSPTSAAVEVYASADDTHSTIQVIDRGAGMDEETVGRALAPFYSGRGSTGIGLAVCRDIVEGMGGTIRIDSAPGQGTTVTVEIPRPRSTEPEDAPPPHDSPGSIE